MFNRKREIPYAYGVKLKFVIGDVVTLELEAQKISEDDLSRRICECIELYSINRGRNQNVFD